MNHQSLPRRRGVELEEAILMAALEELNEVGFNRFTLESIARRAQTGNASVYRRWNTKSVLILAALSRLTPDVPDIARRGSLRNDLIRLCWTLANGLQNSSGAVRNLVGAFNEHPELLKSYLQMIVYPRLNKFHEMLLDAADRGEIERDRVTHSVVMGVPSVIAWRYFMEDGSYTQAEVAAMIDEILMPAISLT